MQAVLEKCLDALGGLLCHPALIEAAIKAPGVSTIVTQLLECQDQHGFGAALALTVRLSSTQHLCVRGTALCSLLLHICCSNA